MFFVNPCAIGKARRKMFPKNSKERDRELCELWWFDTCGPLKGFALDGSKYFITFTEHYSLMKYTFLIKAKSDAIRVFKMLKARAERRTGRCMQNCARGQRERVRCRRDGTTPGSRRYSLSVKCRILFCSEWNCGEGTCDPDGLGAINDTECKVAQRFLGEAVLVATHIHNLCPHPVLAETTPHEVMEGTKTNLDSLRMFGCDAFGRLEGEKKTEARAKKYTFIGYAEHQKGYKLYDWDTNHITIAHHVQFSEDGFGERSERMHSRTTMLMRMGGRCRLCLWWRI